MNWNGLIVADSGGFQVLSLVYSNPGLGSITDKGVSFKKGQGGKSKKSIFTPEKSISVQMDIGADILICLDDCPEKNAKEEQLAKSAWRTIEWAKRCKDEFEKQIEKIGIDNNRPLLFAVVQGGSNKKLREKCAKELIEIGFDGYCFGGWPTDEKNKLDKDILKFTADLLPDDKPKFALGVGSPEGIIEGVKMGYNIFDCVLPTRDARHKRLYVFTELPASLPSPFGCDQGKQWTIGCKSLWEYFYPDKEKNYRDFSPVSGYCDCHTCQNYSRSYLCHLFEIGDSLAWRLATIHNLRFYSQLIDILRKN